MLEPISENQRQQVIETTGDYIRLARDLFRIDLVNIPVLFDLRGRSAGMYRVRCGERVIRYNPYLLARYFDDGLAVTVPHEVSHYVTDRFHGLANVRPHGPEWRTVMAAFGADARATGRFDLSGIPLRQERRHPYRCDCNQHMLTTRRHNRIINRRASYACRQCGTTLRYVDGEPAPAMAVHCP